MPPRAKAEDATSHDDLMLAIGQLSGETKANFTTLFVQHRKMGDELSEIRDKVIAMEARAVVAPPNSTVVATPPGKRPWWTRPAVIAAIVAILGGLSAAYEQAARIVVAVAHALQSAPPTPPRL